MNELYIGKTLVGIIKDYTIFLGKQQYQNINQLGGKSFTIKGRKDSDRITLTVDVKMELLGDVMNANEFIALLDDGNKYQIIPTKTTAGPTVTIEGFINPT
ncbi:MAG: hypothetical protein HN525_00625 [Candidatus Marinimicrobia bacterium]|jgi:hypothetical protein|nr:hypothetical protein [Candidatus Neomarinimicrobiota bacterium]